MSFSFRNCCRDLLHLCYPHNCEGCGTDVLSDGELLCAACVHGLPRTDFFSLPRNPVEKLFDGRLPIENAGAAYYFTKASLVQHLFTQLKYRNNREAGYFFGRMMGHALQNADPFRGVDLLVPLPLHPRKAHSRGYNQAAVICEGIQEIWKKPVLPQAVCRVQFTETQTHQNRVARWQNMAGVFAVADKAALRHKHILLVDDVITTGATLEACGATILETEGVSLSIASAAYTL